ncbi:autotransporter domain-containing protein [Pseudomonas fluorescens]|uniref:autotransporter domain-containing protein n=1 Tax=Pseudomonas fluorescens TaxID=294 RepID=UPI001930C019|nr:autotransporter domain-containing protein [Pseudomonas fluorescens]MBD8092550.1 autotransporter domain-containing protein [Pseudomonas fluorescens]
MSKSSTRFQLRNDHLKAIIRVKSLLSVVLLTQTAFGQGHDADEQITTGMLWPYVKPHTLEDPSLWSADAEYRANWGLSLVGFNAAYAAGAYGQNIKVGVLDDGTWSGHDEFKTRNNVKGFGAPFDGTEIPKISGTGKLLNHGLHVAGIIGANRDSQGMHGGAFLSTIYAGVGAGVGSKLTEPGAAEAVIKSGVDFLNNSWGNNFQRTIRYPSATSNAGTISEYAVPISVEVDRSLRTLQHGPDIHTSDRVSRHLLPGSRLTMQSMLDIARSGTVNIFSTGNDVYNTSLFRGISPSPLTVTLPNVLAAGPSWLKNEVSTSGDTYRALSRQLQLADALSSNIETYRAILRDVDRLDTETQRDPRVVLLAEKLRLLIEPIGDKDTGFEKRKQLNSNTAWRETEPESLLPLKTLRTDFLGIASLTDGDLETYLVNAKGQLDRLDPVEKLHPSVITFQTELANLAADSELYKRGKFEPSTADRAFLQSVRTQDDFRQIEKHWLTVANLSNDERVTSNSNICGPSKYYCVSAPGGSYSQVPSAQLLDTPDVPPGLSIFDQRGNALQGQVSALDYQIFSLGITSDVAAGSTQAEKQAAAKSAYQLMGGTSMAAPHVTAGLAVIKSRFPYLENSQVRDTLLSTAKDVGAPGIDRVYGWGMMDLEKAMGGPAKLWQLKKGYDLTFAEERAAQKYNPIVAQADYYERAASLARVLSTLSNQPLLSAYERLAIEINRLVTEGNAANAQAGSAYEQGDRPSVLEQSALAQAKFSEARAKFQEANRIADEIRNNDALAIEAQGRMRANELTRNHPNEPEDTLSAAFESFDFRVDLPGERTAECDSQACVADYWTNDIDGPGGLTKLGEGVLALTGDNTYEGGTRIENGVLQLGMGGTRGSVTGNIVNNAVLAFHRADEYVFQEVISGTGSLETYGGTLRLQGNNTYSGDTHVNGGFLTVDGSVESRVNVNYGGSLGGFGRVGSLVVQNGGTLALGPSVGTLTVSDDARFEPGSLYEVKIAADMNSSDRLQVLGAVELLGGTVSVRLEGDENPLAQLSAEALFSRKYDIVTAQKGVTNRFASVTPQYNYITALLDYGDKNKVMLNFDLTQEAKSEEARKKQAELKVRERELADLKATAQAEGPAAQLPVDNQPSMPPTEAVAEVELTPAPPVAVLEKEASSLEPPLDNQPSLPPAEAVAEVEPTPAPPVAVLEKEASSLEPPLDNQPSLPPAEAVAEVEPTPAPPVAVLEKEASSLEPPLDNQPSLPPAEAVAEVRPTPAPPVAVLEKEANSLEPPLDNQPSMPPAEAVAEVKPTPASPVAVLEKEASSLEPPLDNQPSMPPAEAVAEVKPTPALPVAVLEKEASSLEPPLDNQPSMPPTEAVAEVVPTPVPPVAVSEKEASSLEPPLDNQPSMPPAEVIAEVVPTPVPPVAVFEKEPAPFPPTMEPAKPIDEGAVATLEADVQRRKLELLDLRFRELDILGATTPNQQRVGASLKSFGVMRGHPLVEGLLGSKAGEIPDFESLSGDMHVTLSGVLPNDSRFVARVALNRLRMRLAEPLVAEYSLVDSPLLADLSPGRNAFAFLPAPKESIFWAQAYGGRTHASGDGNASGYYSNSGGLVLGVDSVASNDWRLGLLASFGSTSLKNDTGRASIDNYRLGVYGGTQLQGIGLRLGANLAWHQVDTKRQVHWFDLTENSEASYDAVSTELYGELAYPMATPVAVFEPFIGVSHVNVRTDGFKEDGAITGLASSSATTHTSVVTTGLHVSHKIKPNDATTLTARGMLGWSQAFGDTSPEASHGFVGADRFEVQGLPMVRERTTVELGLDAGVGHNTSLGVAYTRQFAGAITDSAVEANVQFRF